MNNKSIRSLLVRCAFAATGVFSAAANAQYIVNTGGNADGAPWLFGPSQYFGGEFSVSDAYTITGVEGFFSYTNKVDIALHTDGGNVPGSILFSGTIDLSGDETASEVDWRGLTGLSWSVAAGTYWVSFRPFGFGSGIMPGDAPSPLAEYAQGSGVYAWDDCGPDCRDYLDVGVRIEAVAAIPEPETYAMLLAGLGLLGFSARRRKLAA